MAVDTLGLGKPPATLQFGDLVKDKKKPFSATPGGLGSLSPTNKPFDIGQTELFKQSAQATQKQLAGETPAFDTQANVARETQKAAQAQRAKSIREGLVSRGLGDTGKFVSEGIVAPEQQEFRETQDLERKLIADKAAQSQAQIAQGQGTVQGLLGLKQQQEAQKTGIEAQKEAQLTDIGASTDMTLLQDKLLSGQKVTDNEFSEFMTNLDAQIADAADDQDFTQEKFLTDQQNKLSIQMQLQDMTQEEKMLTLQNDYQTFKDNGDFDKAIKLKDFEHDLAMEKMTGSQAFEEKMAYLDNSFEEAMKAKDFANVQILEDKKYAVEMQQHADNLAIKNAQLELEQQGFDMEQFQTELANLEAQVAAGQLDPNVMLDKLAENLSDQQAQVLLDNKPNPQSTQKALKEDMLNQKFQFALALGDTDGDGELDGAVYDEDGNFAGLKDEEAGQFHDHLMDTIYTIDGTPLQSDIVGLKAGEIPIDQMEEKHYDYLLDDVTVPNVSQSSYTKAATQESGSGSKSRTIWPELENTGGFTNIDGVLFNIDSRTILDEGGDDVTVYNLVDVVTGQTLQINAAEKNASSANPTSEMDIKSVIDSIKQDPYYLSRS
jgi:hypothetical protein